MNIENRELSQKLVDTIEFLKQSISKISVYDLNYYSMTELYYNIAKKINELIEMYHEFGVSISEEIIKQNECLQYLLNEGLVEEVIKKLNSMIDDGTMDTIINHTIFNDLSSKVEDSVEKISILLTDKVNVLSFGAKGDGVTDDTNSIQDAINFVHNVENLKYVFIPRGTYMISKPLIIPVGVSLIGGEGLTGEYNTTIVKNSNSNVISSGYSTIDKTGKVSFEVDSILTFIDDFPVGYTTGKLNNGAGKSIIKNLYLKSNAYSTYGIFTANLNNIEFENIKITNVNTAFKSNLLWMASFKNIMFQNIFRGFDIDYGIDGWNTTINMYKCYVHSCEEIGYKFKKIASVHMDTCVYEESSGSFIYAEDRTRITLTNPHTEQCGYRNKTGGTAFKDNSFISLSDSSLTINGGFLQFDNNPTITTNPFNSCFSLVNRSNVIMNNTAIYLGGLSVNSLFIYCADRSKFYLNSFTPMHTQSSILGGGQYCDDTSKVYINNNRPADTWLLRRLGYPCLDTNDKSSNFKIYVDSVRGNDFYPGTLDKPKRTINQALKMIENANCNDVQEIYVYGDFSDENIEINSSNCRISIRGYNDSYANIGKLTVNNSHNLHFKYLSFTSPKSVIELNYSHVRFEYVKVNGNNKSDTSQIGINIQGGQCTVENYIEFNDVYTRIQATRGAYLSTLCDAVSNGNGESRMKTYSAIIITNIAPTIKEENNGGKIYS